jgi:hypothetical protein
MFFVSVASKRLSLSASLLFATLAGRSISVASKRLKAIVGGNPDRVGAGQWTVVSKERNSGSKPGRGRRTKREKVERARIRCDVHTAD